MDEFDSTYFMYDGDSETRFDSVEEARRARAHYGQYGHGGSIRQYWVKELSEEAVQVPQGVV